MNSLIWLLVILVTLAGMVLGLAGFVFWTRHRSVREFIARRRGREILAMVEHGPKPRMRICSCCGGPMDTANFRPNCMRNAANAQKRV